MHAVCVIAMLLMVCRSPTGPFYTSRGRSEALHWKAAPSSKMNAAFDEATYPTKDASEQGNERNAGERIITYCLLITKLGLV